MIKYFRIGKILKAQGIKGEAKVFITSSDINRYKDLKKVYLVKNENVDFDLNSDNSKICIVTNVKMLNDGVVLKLDKIDTIEDIERYRGYSIYIDREDSIKLDKNEYFSADLIGMKALDNQDGKLLNGEVVDVEELKNSFNLIIKNKDKNIAIPFAADYIINIDMDARTIIINIIEGILDI